MNLNKTDLNLFVVFDAIYTEGNLTRAGQILGITQPAVSNALSRLRIIFNDPLFTRTSQGMMPTTTAKNISVQIRQALQMLRHSIQETARFEPVSANKTYRFNIGDYEESLILPRLLNQVSNLSPGIVLNSQHFSIFNPITELESGQSDFAITRHHINHENLHSLPLFEDPFVCYLRSNHPLAGRSLTLDDYLELQHIQIASEDDHFCPIDFALSKQGYKRTIAFQTRHFLIAPSVVKHSDFAMTAPRSLSERFPELVVKTLPMAIENYVVNLYWHDIMDKDPANIWMRSLIGSLFAGEQEEVVQASA